MTSRNALIDTNSYVRLAQSIHPLLGEILGASGLVLFLIAEFEQEYAKSNRLQVKHSWVNQEQYKSNRKNKLKVPAFKKSEIENARFFIRETAIEIKSNISPVDIHALAVAYVLNIPLITDDVGMLSMAEEYEITAWSSLDLLKIIMDSKFIDIQKVRGIVQYWQYLPDQPSDLKKNYGRIFCEEFPHT